MALSLITSYYVAQTGSQGTGALTTPSFTPSNGEVIIVKLETWDTGTAMGAPTGGSQTYASRIILAPGGFDPWVGIYTAVISGSPGSMTISSTPAASARYSMCVERWSGAQLAATPVTGSTNGTGGAASSSLAPTGGSSSVISWVAGDAQSIDPATRTYLGSGTDEGTRDDHVGANGVGYHGRQASTGTGSQSFGLSTPTGMIFGIAGIEVQAAAGAAATFVPQSQTRRRLQLPRRSQRIQAPVRAQVNPPFPFNQVKQPRELRGLLPKRGRTSAPVPQQVVIAAPTTVTQPVRSRLRGLRLFRGRSATPVPAQVAAAPAYPLQALRARVRGLRLFRSRSAGPVPPQVVIAPTYPPQPVRERVRGLRPPRGHVSAPPVDQPVPVQGAARGRVKGFRARLRPAAPPIDQAAPPGQQRQRLRLPKLFRGRVAQVVAPQTAAAPPPYPPQPVRTRLRGLRIFRGRSAGPIPDQVVVAAPPYPPQSVRARLRFLRVFRGRTATVVPAQVVVTPPAYAPQSVRSRLRGLRLFRGRSSGVVPPQIVVQPPAYAPLSVRSRLKWLRWFRPRSAVAPAVQAVPPAAPHVRPHPMAPRRGRDASPPMPQPVAPPAFPPQPVRTRLKGLRPARGRSAGVVPPQVALIAPAFAPAFARAKRRIARLFRGTARLVPFTDTTPVVQPRTPTVTVDLGRPVVAVDLARTVVTVDVARQVAPADLSRITATADLSRPSVTVAL